MSLDQPESAAAILEPRQDITLHKDVLIKRLNDVLFRLSKESMIVLDYNTILAINSEVDHIELLLGEAKLVELDGEDGQELEDSQIHTNAGNNDLRNGPTPTQESEMPIEPSSQTTSLMPRLAPSITARALEIANAAEQLASQLATSVEEFQKRKEESEHIYGLLITRAEMAAERIICLESEISEMDDDIKASQSELRFLRIQLQAIEAQCSQYMPREEDEELSQSIMNWKVDWENIDRRSRARRLKRSALLDNVRTSSRAGG